MKPTVVAYSDKDSVRPGDRIAFKVSCEGAEAFRADIVRLRSPDTGPEGPGYKEVEIETEISGEYPARRQTIGIGSCARIPFAAPLLGLKSFTVLCAVWPTRPGAGEQGLIGNWREGENDGFALHLDATGAVALSIGDGKARQLCSTGVSLEARRWHLVAASYDAQAGTARLHQIPLSDGGASIAAGASVLRKASRGLRVASRDLLIAAWHAAETGERPLTTAHFDGKIDRPRLFSRALAEHEIWTGIQAPLPDGMSADLVAAWDFSLDISADRITDAGPNALHGHVVNLPARGQTGFNWSGREFCWRHAPAEYGAIHFHSDDLYDAGWDADFSLRIDPQMQSGIYGARLRAGEAEFYVPFYVRPPAGKRTADTLFLVPTATYLAYANNRGRIVSPATDYLIGKLTVVDEIDLLIVDRLDYGLSTYDAHRDGSSVNYSSRLRPVTNHRPKDSDMGMAYNNFAADLLVVDWLEEAGVSYDVLTDEDLHYEGAKALEGYRVIVTGTHPEYTSVQMLDALMHFTHTGGRLMYLGGNGFYWRVAFRPDKPGALELRRAQINSPRWNPGLGQYFHSFSGEHGGLWRDLGRSPQKLAGVGFISQGFDCSSYYRRTAAASDSRVSFIFEGVEGEKLGDFGLLRGGAAGVEIDRTDERLGSPAHALAVAHSEGHTNVYEAFEEVVAMGQTLARDKPAIRADMVFFECPGGGAVFSVGSIAYAGSLSHNGYDNNIFRLTTNVLKRFVDPEPFEMPGTKPR